MPITIAFGLDPVIQLKRFVPRPPGMDTTSRHALMLEVAAN